MARVIGIDFGNWNAFVCFADGMNEATRRGGKIIDIVPDRYRQNSQNGFPNEFFWGVGRDGVEREFFGFEAVVDSNQPPENHLRLLKRGIGKQVTLYDTKKTKSRSFKYDDLITRAFSYMVSLANEALRESYGESGTTNLISVTYPASLSDPASLRYFIDLAEKADSGARDKNGKMLKIKVIGAICEPAAAGLDRLSEQRENTVRDVETFGVCDLGGGTYDLSIVTLYPKGRKYADNSTYYYDIVCEGEGLNIGGNDFNDILGKLYLAKLKKEIQDEPSNAHNRVTRKNVERCKLELSNGLPEAVIPYDYDGDIVDIAVTYKEFTEAIAPKVKEIVEKTRKFFNDHVAHKPDGIILTGGSFYIPYIVEQLEKALPEFAGKINRHKPCKAAAHGAARFYNPVPVDVPTPTPTPTPGYNANKSSIVRKTLAYDITTKIKTNGRVEMTTLIKKGTVIPCSSGQRNFVSEALGAASTDYDIFMANKANPTPTKVSEDYAIIAKAILNHPNEPKTQKVSTHCTVSVDELGSMKLKAWTDNSKNLPIDIDAKLPGSLLK